jgi:uncharacterized delta-60 repeat protein
MQLLKRHPIVFVTMTLLIALSFLVACESGSELPAPSISGINPDKAPAGTEVTITGTNLGTDGVPAKILFDGRPAAVVSSAAGSGKLTVKVPSLNPGTYPVLAQLGERAPSNSVPFQVVQATPPASDPFDALAPGTLDPNFGVDGVIRSQETYYLDDPESSFDWLYQTDGKFLVISGDLNLYRWNQDTSIDKNFGINGFIKLAKLITTQGSVSRPKIYQMTSGKYLVSMNQGGYPNEEILQVWVLNSNGTLDKNFGTSGTLVVSDPNKKFGYFAAAPLINGKILILGRNSSRSVFQMHLSNGKLDNNFALDGKLFVDSGEGKLDRMKTLSDGSILIYGVTNQSGSFSNEIFHMIKTTPLGVVDEKFVFQKYYGIDLLINDSYRNSIIELNGNIYIILEGKSGFYSSIIVKLLLDGVLDPNFQINTDLFVNNLVSNSKGSLFLLGSVDFNKNAAIEKYNPNGIFEKTFGDSGKRVIPNASSETIGRTLSGKVEEEKLTVYGIFGSKILSGYTPTHRIFSARIKN